MHDTTPRPIDRLESDWVSRCHTTASVGALRRLAAAEPEIADIGARDLGDLVGWLQHTREGGGGDRAAAVLRAMLRHGGVDPLVPRALLQALLPGLVGVARRLAWGSGGDWESPSAFFVDLTATAWELVVEWSGADRPYAVLDLLSAARCRMRRQLVRHRRVRQQLAPDVEVAHLRSEPTRRGLSDLDELARALDELSTGEGDPVDSAVLYAHRVLGYTMTELAQLTGRSRRSLAARRDRAAQLLTA